MCKGSYVSETSQPQKTKNTAQLDDFSSDAWKYYVREFFELSGRIL